MSADNLLDQLQDDIVARLASDPLFSNIIIIEERLGTTDTEMSEALAKVKATGVAKPGIGVIVQMPARVPHTEASGPQYLLRCRILLVELPRINTSLIGNGKSSRLVTLKIDQLFHQWDLGGRAFAIESVVPHNDGEGEIGFLHTLLWQSGQVPPLQCRAPSIAVSAGTATLTNNEAGAAVYYTVNGSFPWSGNSTATLYTIPFSATGVTIRAAAYLSGKQGSDVPQKTAP